MERPGYARGAERPRAWRMLLAIVLIGINLRPIFTSVGAVLEQIQADLGLTGGAAGLLTTLPMASIGAVSLTAGWLIGRIGVRRGMNLALALLTIGTALRLFSDVAGILFLATLLGGLGMAAAQVLVPVVVKGSFPRQGARVMSAFTTAMNGGAAMAAAATVPLAHWLGSWSLALALWTLPVLLAWLCWPRRAGPGQRATSPISLPWRSRTGWRLAALLACSSSVYVSLLGWTVPLFSSNGLAPEVAGLMLTVMVATQVASALVIPNLVAHQRDRRPCLVICHLVILAALAGMAVAPGWHSWLWVALAGLGLGAAYPMMLTLPLDYAATPQEAGRLSAMGIGLGSLLSSSVPWLVGVTRDASGGFVLPMTLLMALALGAALISFMFRPAAEAASPGDTTPVASQATTRP